MECWTGEGIREGKPLAGINNRQGAPWESEGPVRALKRGNARRAKGPYHIINQYQIYDAEVRQEMLLE